MKSLIIGTFLLMAGATQAARVDSCVNTYNQKVKYQSERREVVSTREIDITLEDTLNKFERKAFDHYISDVLPDFDEEETYEVQLAVYKDKKSGKVNAYRVKIDSATYDEDVTSYYLTTDGRIMKLFIEGQSSESRWICQGFTSTEEKFIKGLAREMGEYFDPSEIKGAFTGMKTSQLPSRVKKLFKKLVTERADENSQHGYYEDRQDGAMEGEVYAILKDGEVVGFVLGVYDDINHPLWDGSGVNHYVTKEGKVVISVDWAG